MNKLRTLGGRIMAALACVVWLTVTLVKGWAGKFKRWWNEGTNSRGNG